MGGDRSLLPDNKRQDKRKPPQVTPGEVTLGMRQNIFTARVVKLWKRLLMEAVESPALEVCQKYINAVLGDRI